MTRYTGRIIRVSPRGYGWIDRKSVTNIDGLPADLATDKDIYIHRTALSYRLRLQAGNDLTFSVVPDPKRASGFRAVDAGVYRRRALGIDLHVDATRVDNPSVPMRWCFTAEMHKYITEGLKKGYGYAVVLVGKRRDDDLGLREVREVLDWKQSFTFFTFTAPGDWDVCALLYERTKISTATRSASRLLEMDLRQQFLDWTRFMGRRVFDVQISDLEELQYLEHTYRYRVGNSMAEGEPIAAQTISISVPKEIFAPEPSEAVKAYGNYFFRHEPGDQCDFRRRQLVMIPGFFAWVAIEGLKRTGTLLWGMIALLFFWVHAFDLLGHAFKPAIRLGTLEEKEYDSENGMLWPFNRRPLGWFVPGMLLIYAAVLWFLWKVAWPFLVWLTSRSVVAAPKVNWVPVLIGLGVIALLVCGSLLISHLKRKHNSYESRTKRRQAEKAREAEREAAIVARHEREAAVAVTYAPALVCGDAPAEVSLKAVPRELRTRHVLFASLKQQVCRPFAR